MRKQPNKFELRYSKFIGAYVIYERVHLIFWIHYYQYVRSFKKEKHAIKQFERMCTTGRDIDRKKMKLIKTEKVNVAS